MKLVVIGGGPAGMAAAYSAAQTGVEVVLLEHNEKLGKKLYITGKGRCNVTNTADKEKFMANIATNPRFLYSSLSEYDSAYVIDFFEKNGTPLKVERGCRVFPQSDKAVDITKTFERVLQKYRVKIIFNVDVKSLCIEDNVIVSVITDKGQFFGDAFVLATGGVTYKATGCDGSGYTLAKQAGHTIIQPKPSLCGIKTKVVYPLMGLTLKNVLLKIYDEKGKADSEFGELLFTHEGISGPIVLTLSSRLNKRSICGNKIEIDLKPALNSDELDNRLLRDFAENTNRLYKNAMDALLPQSLIPVFIKVSGISENRRVNEITAKERKMIGSLLKAFPLTAQGFCDIDSAIVTSGGVNVKEINPKSMRSKLTDNLYFAGEIIDVDAQTGGFNIQIAIATGFTAGKHAAEDMECRQ